MSTLPQIDPANATGEAVALLEQLRKRIGAVPNMAKAMASSPALLKGWMELSGALAGSASGGAKSYPYRVGWEDFLRHLVADAPLCSDFAAGIRDVAFAEACGRSFPNGAWVGFDDAMGG